MATIQIPSLVVLPTTPDSGDLLVIRSAGADYKVDYDVLVPVREDTVNNFTGSNTFNATTTFNAAVEVDTINGNVGNPQATAIELTDVYAIGADITINDTLVTSGTVNLTNDDINITTTGGVKPLLVSEYFNPDLLPSATDLIGGFVELATNIEMQDGTGGDSVITSDNLAAGIDGQVTFNINDSNGRTWSMRSFSFKIGGLIINFGYAFLSSTANWNAADITIPLTSGAFRRHFNSNYACFCQTADDTPDFDSIKVYRANKGNTSVKLRLDRSGNYQPPRAFSFFTIGV